MFLARWFVCEFSRWIRNSAFWILMVASVVVILLSAYGTTDEGIDQLSSGMTTAAELSGLAMSMPFAGVLFTTIFGIVIAGDDYSSKFINRLFLVRQNVVFVFCVKAWVAAVLGALIGAVTLVSAYWFIWYLFNEHSIELILPSNLVLWAAEYILMYLLGGVWGVALAILFHSKIIAIVVHIVYQTMLESSLIHFFPKIGKWLPGGAQAAIVEDPSLPERVTVLNGVVIYLTWLLVLVVLAEINRRFCRVPPQKFHDLRA